MDSSSKVLSCFLTDSPEVQGCDENLFDSLPITETCKTFFQKPIKNHPWIKQQEKIKQQEDSCSMQLIDYMENTNVNVNMKKTICQTSSLNHICSQPVLSKMCFGKREAKECKDDGI